MSDDAKPWDLLNPNEPRSQEEEVARRMDICKACPFFVVRTQQCRKCKCFMKLKTKLERAHCPINKW
jgi:hypothetical protein